MTKKERADKAVELLKQRYPEAVCSLNYKTPFQLLIATRLSAQCTEARVNLVTPALFAEFPTAEIMAHAPLSRIEELIQTCGLYKTKAKSLTQISKMLVSDFGGIVPDSIEQLTRLPGVGRKTANLICGDIYGKPAVVTDTHFIRIMNRIGLIDTHNPYKAEMQARAVLPLQEANAFCHRIVLHGRDTCTARRAYCEKCNLNEICKKKGVK